MRRVRESLAELSRSMLNIVYPPLCLLCERELESGGLVCRGCIDKLERLPEPLCGRCGAPLGGAHGSCICGAIPPELEKLRSSVSYEGVAKGIMHFYKFGGYRSLSSLLVRAMYGDAEALVRGEENAVVIGIPLHRARERERGYDQAGMLASGISAATGLPLAEGAVRRGRNTKPQAELSLEERRENLRDAFSMKDASKIAGKTVLLVDDVLTTGITMGFCGSVLKEAGAARVYGLTFARRMRTRNSEQGE